MNWRDRAAAAARKERERADQETRHQRERAEARDAADTSTARQLLAEFLGVGVDAVKVTKPMRSQKLDYWVTLEVDGLHFGVHLEHKTYYQDFWGRRSILPGAGANKKKQGTRIGELRLSRPCTSPGCRNDHVHQLMGQVQGPWRDPMTGEWVRYPVLPALAKLGECLNGCRVLCGDHTPRPPGYDDRW
jgi:hypothetical protein